jgi:hypothetical protein
MCDLYEIIFVKKSHDVTQIMLYRFYLRSVKVVTNNDHVAKDIVNVIAVIKGREDPGK